VTWLFAVLMTSEYAFLWSAASPSVFCAGHWQPLVVTAVLLLSLLLYTPSASGT